MVFSKTLSEIRPCLPFKLFNGCAFYSSSLRGPQRGRSPGAARRALLPPGPGLVGSSCVPAADPALWVQRLARASPACSPLNQLIFTKVELLNSVFCYTSWWSTSTEIKTVSGAMKATLNSSKDSRKKKRILNNAMGLGVAKLALRVWGVNNF